MSNLSKHLPLYESNNIKGTLRKDPTLNKFLQSIENPQCYYLFIGLWNHFCLSCLTDLNHLSYKAFISFSSEISEFS